MSPDVPSSLTAVVAIVCTVLLLGIIKLRRHSKGIQSWPKDVVLLHHCGKGPYAPSLSPFIIKLETFLKLTDIPYEIVRDYKLGPKGKVPWMEYNGAAMGDSQLCMEYLIEELHIDIDDHLSTTERAIGTSFQRMVDEHTYWLMVHWRWAFDNEKLCLKQAKWGLLALTIAKHVQKRATYTQGAGRHTKEELLNILRKDLRALSNFLGTKKYFFGDKPSSVDCSIFGQLSQFLWHLPDSEPNVMLKDEFSNLREYCERMKNTLWKDWNNSLLFPAEHT
ncbi:failed axon connections homolog [Saccostrea echinata]|uniref:failed axon connections homolog n=1 Tax=Saccostrea echinata TaxID=191078 RepID=UPI002A82E3A2|nr:failed axon connections homolog [Saccostrea echinata]